MERKYKKRIGPRYSFICCNIYLQTAKKENRKQNLDEKFTVFRYQLLKSSTLYLVIYLLYTIPASSPLRLLLLLFTFNGEL